jgi:N-acetylmuramoyl-L-alanine amidase
VRVWPADDYTRVTLENDTDLKATHFIVKDPERMVVDIEGLELNPTLKSLVAKIQSNDPYIKQVRVGQNRPNVVRLVFDLKEEVTPQVFTLPPAGNYKHRLIFDLYPVKAADPIAAMIEKATGPTQPLCRNRRQRPSWSRAKNETAEALPKVDKQGKMVRMITIALDPGHGGEDPAPRARTAAAKRTSCCPSPSASRPSWKTCRTCA